jgi:hypothetical protein
MLRRALKGFVLYIMMQTCEEQPDSNFINIKIKTLNHSLYDIIANPLRKIRCFQTQIEQVPMQPSRKPACLWTHNACSTEASCWTPRRPWRTTASSRATSSS